jgi:hypothetical protein
MEKTDQKLESHSSAADRTSPEAPVVNFITILGDNPHAKDAEALADKIYKALKDPDDPVIVFSWRYENVGTFLARADQLGFGGPPPPPMIQALLVAVDLDPNVRIRMLIAVILLLVAVETNVRVIDGQWGTAGLMGTGPRMNEAGNFLGLMQFQVPWFHAVFAGEFGLMGPLARLHWVTASDSRGASEPLHFAQIGMWDN